MIEQANTALVKVLDQSWWALDSTAMAAQISGLERTITLARTARGLLARELAGRNWPALQGATSTATFLRDLLRVSVGTGTRLTRLGDLADGRPRTRDALTSGAVTVDQALVIRDVLADLPAGLDPAVVDECESALIGFAATYEPAVLRRLGERILAHVAPEVADAELARKLEREEAAARQRRVLTITDTGHGIHRVVGRLDTESAAILTAALDPLSAPIPGTGRVRDPRTAGQRRADALIDVCRFTLTHDDLPVNGGNRPQLNVTVDFNALTRQLAVVRRW